jgi:VCBS repeat-containing protein
MSKKHAPGVLVLGTHGDDVLVGSPGDDWLFALKGDDELSGAEGNDKLKGGKDDDRAIYNMSENLGAGFTDIGTRDLYDGGKGSDTLVLEFTHGEYLLASVQQDIADFRAFLADGRSGPKWFEFTSFDLRASNFEALEIVFINTAPTAVADAAATDEETAITIEVLANDSDPDHLDVITLFSVNAASVLGASVSANLNGTVTYTPGDALQWLSEGQVETDSFPYTIVDLGGLTATATVSVAVTGVNDVPEILTADTQGGVIEKAEPDEGGPLSDTGVIDFFDIDKLDTHTASFAAQGTDFRGSFAVTLDDDAETVTWTFSVEDAALDDLAQDETLTQAYQVTIDDGHAGGTVSRIVEITLTGTNDVPDAVDDAHTMNEDTVATINVLANDDDVDGDTLSVTAVGAAANGSVVINADNTVTYTPNANFFGTDSFSYTVDDDNGGTDTATVNVTVVNVPEARKGTVADEVPPGADLQYFMRVDEATNDWVELHGFSFGMSQTGTIGGGGGGAGKTNVTDVSVSFNTAPSAADLFAAGLAGEHLKFVEIEAYALGGKDGARLVDEFKFDDVLVSSHQVSGAFGMPEQHAVSFNFTKVGHTHVEQDEKGGLGDKTSMSYDVQAGTVDNSGPAAAAEAIKGEQEPVVGSDLELYLRVDGVGAPNEWLKLGSFSLGLSNPASSSGGGGGAGKVIFQDLHVSLGSSSELVELTQMLAMGEHIKSAELEVYATGGKAGHQIIDEFKFEDVLVSEWQTFDASTNHLSFEFAEVSYGHQLYDEIGQAKGFAGDHDPFPDIGFF